MMMTDACGCENDLHKNAPSPETSLNHCRKYLRQSSSYDKEVFIYF